MRQIQTDRSHHIETRQISFANTDLVMEGYALLQEALGTDGIENLGSFLETVSPQTDPLVVPKLAGAMCNDDLVGIIVGAYLCSLNMGFIAYSAVRDDFRRRGIYTALRSELVEQFSQYSSRPTMFRRGGFETCPYITPSIGSCVSAVISELDEGGWLFDKYVRDWGALVLPCDYEQPEAQGLPAKPMKLVLQPMGDKTSPDKNRIIEIVREIYERIYRIPNAEENTTFLRIVASINV